MPQNFFKSNFKFLRKKAGETQAESGSGIGRIPQTISLWENGTNEPGLDDLINISIKYGISIDDLLKIDLAKGKGIDEEKNISKSKGKGKETGKEINEIIDFTGVEALKIALSAKDLLIAAKDQVISVKDQVIAGQEAHIGTLKDSLSMITEENDNLKRDVSLLEKQINSHTGRESQNEHKRSA
jgi:transcriptional regulator with XRE-family HTH domain